MFISLICLNAVCSYISICKHCICTICEKVWLKAAHKFLFYSTVMLYATKQHKNTISYVGAALIMIRIFLFKIIKQMYDAYSYYQVLLVLQPRVSLAPSPSLCHGPPTPGIRPWTWMTVTVPLIPAAQHPLIPVVLVSLDWDLGKVMERRELLMTTMVRDKMRW